MKNTTGNSNGNGQRRVDRVRFPLGRTLATPGAIDALSRAGEEAATYLDRHARGDWGTVNDEDWRENDIAIDRGLRILSAYQTSAGDKLWIITEADRSTTTILLPEEY